MSKKYKKSNDSIPKDELLLAKLIQNAEAFGLVSCQGANFRRNGGYSSSLRTDDATACCALGASQMASDTRAEIISYDYVASGNDADVYMDCPAALRDNELSGFTIGAAFQLALKD